MKQVYSIAELKDCLALERLENRHVGFVPTMGALHDGHLSLVRRCVIDNDVCVVSIFVNPTQFNNTADLETYPRTPEKDCAMLEAAGCDYLFMPSVKEMYPVPDKRTFDFGQLAQTMEGAFRPGHFNGVAQIVSKLFDTVGACLAYFGEKDFQQLVIIRRMVEQLGLDVRIIACPIMRHEDGLAMSSRNARLTGEQRQIAPLIYRTLTQSALLAPTQTVQQTIDFVVSTLSRQPQLRVEYFEIVDSRLTPVSKWGEAPSPTGCTAVYCGQVRLIDNISYKI
ncbi:MAG: pantoate--beta-alanine ligase [Tannerellaceae bacterium]|jgi:pantoate--beta-alanine ligase|nr:pantoate--beta-alanine ligase [Tannerellaceae bacterium]